MTVRARWLVGLLAVGALAAGCSPHDPSGGASPTSAPGILLGPGPAPGCDDGTAAADVASYVLSTGDTVEICPGEDLPREVLDDVRKLVAAETEVFVEAAAAFAADGRLTPEQTLQAERPAVVAKELSAAVADVSGTTPIIVHPAYGSVDGVSFGTVWTSTRPEVTGIAPTSTWDEQVVRLNRWSAGQPRTSSYETVVQPP